MDPSLARYNQTTEDETLWLAFKKGDEKAFTLLYQRYVRVLFSYGKKLSGDEAVVEDTIQDLFIDLWRTREKLSDVLSVKFYLYRSLRRNIHKSIRPDYAMQEDWETTKEELLPILPSTEALLVEMENSQMHVEQVQHWLKALPIRQYEAITLRFYQDLNYTEIGELLSVNEQSARNLVQKALLKLRKIAIILLTGLLVGRLLLF